MSNRSAYSDVFRSPATLNLPRGLDYPRFLVSVTLPCLRRVSIVAVKPTIGRHAYAVARTSNT
jgi:hypothetical protein